MRDKTDFFASIYNGEGFFLTDESPHTLVNVVLRVAAKLETDFYGLIASFVQEVLRGPAYTLCNRDCVFGAKNGFHVLVWSHGPGIIDGLVDRHGSQGRRLTHTSPEGFTEVLVEKLRTFLVDVLDLIVPRPHNKRDRPVPDGLPFLEPENEPFVHHFFEDRCNRVRLPAEALGYRSRSFQHHTEFQVHRGLFLGEQLLQDPHLHAGFGCGESYGILIQLITKIVIDLTGHCLLLLSGAVLRRSLLGGFEIVRGLPNNPGLP